MSYTGKSRRGGKRQRNGDVYICGICDIRFKSESEFVEHAVFAHGDNM